jgi:hypothetical protein
MPVILVNKVVDPKRIFRKKWRHKERHKGPPTPPKNCQRKSLELFKGRAYVGGYMFEK